MMVQVLHSVAQVLHIVAPVQRMIIRLVQHSAPRPLLQVHQVQHTAVHHILLPMEHHQVHRQDHRLIVRQVLLVRQAPILQVPEPHNTIRPHRPVQVTIHHLALFSIVQHLPHQQRPAMLTLHSLKYQVHRTKLCHQPHRLRIINKPVI